MTTLTLTRALVYLQSRSITNALKARLLRLKQPKYLVGAVIGLGYMYWWIGRAIFSGWRGARTPWHPPPEAIQTFEASAAAILFLVVAGIWIFAGSRASLQFSESELAFLLPAPLSRRMLIRYKLLRAQLGTLISALFLTLLTGRFARDGHAVTHVLGGWLGLTILNLHGMAASFTIQRLTERGLASWKRRVGALLILVGLVTLVWVWLRALPPSPVLKTDPLGAARDLGDWIRLAFNSGPAPWLLLPFRWVVNPWFATSLGEFLWALLPVMLLIGLHYWWVERCDVSFEEASLELAKKRAEFAAAARQGKRPGLQPRSKPAPGPFPLAPTGFAPVALMWKNLVQARVTLRKLGAGAAFVAVVGIATQFSLLPEAARFIPCFLFSLAFVAMALVGGGYTSHGLRHDLGLLDLLKGYPLAGWQIVLGELLGPATAMTGLQLLAAVGAAVTFPRTYLAEEFSPLLFAVAALSAAVVAAPLNLLNAVIPSAATLLFPAWAKPGRDIQQPGFEAMGQRLLFGVAQLAVMFLALLPAAALGFGGFALMNWLAGPWLGFPAAALLAAAVLSAQAWFGVRMLGRLFERYDASSEQ